jgi:2,5-diamino-6-(ribosylamino)-4(3H)-pyrimidinone 5'-phosphate reductase
MRPLIFETLLGSLSPPDTRPLVTLTFAQSLDAKIADQNNRQLILSGKNSMIMTHWMRSFHHAILIGIGTALSDNPQLNSIYTLYFYIYTIVLSIRIARLLPDQGQQLSVPRPIVLDSRLRLSPDCKLLSNYRAQKGRRPYVIAADPHIADADWKSRRTALEAAGARVLTVPTQDHLLHLPTVFRSLRNLGITSLMVEGGAAVISSLLSAHPDLVDTIVVTVAPTFVGDQGVSYHAPFQNVSLSVTSSRFYLIRVHSPDSITLLRRS